MTPTRRFIVLGLTIAALAIGAMWLPVDRVQPTIAGWGALAPVAAVIVGAALLVALVPRTPVSIACGLLFGAVGGTVCAVAVALLAAVATFALGRALGRDFVASRAGRRWRRLEWWLAREGTLAVAAVRSLPLGPYGLIGYAYGTSTVRPLHYGLGTAIAAVPSALAYALVGAAIGTASATNPLNILPLLFGLLLSVTLAVRLGRHLREQRAGAANQPAQPHDANRANYGNHANGSSDEPGGASDEPGAASDEQPWPVTVASHSDGSK